MTQSLNIIFAGTPPFAADALQALIDNHYTIKAVYTQPDRPAGRGRKLTPSPVKQLALEHHIPVYQPVTLRDASEQQKLKDLHADIMVVAAYGLLLPLPVLTAPRLGCINIHASLLPRWRGAAPIQRAILAGDTTTGITIMQMDKGLDTGAMLYKVECPILSTDTSETLHDKLSQLGKSAIITTLSNLSQCDPTPQDNALATYAAKITKEEAEINWGSSAADLDRLIRAFNPWPVAFTQCDDRMIRIWQAVFISTAKTGVPGEIIDASSEGIDVATGNGVLRIEKLQLPGGRVMTARDILNARHSEFAIGKVLG